ncbi:prolipoprotein diacylglyceryl transferase [Occallatibacter riparius]|uniref:Prolipoprotein diacylglyceryl transferase n=1 Tax=Occallatibacter riparius TaxID=1002689 RepID=A0A9J7BYP3_9BACT|nr:prolipoprotein diacylglyceryl transferase [Occallatibacter riparius]UWZ86470.1 prolipoprotein diacylglyceryl transferase [Occallatibacter riparius]
MHPVLFHIGALLIPSYGALAALGVLLALMLAQRTARTAGVPPAQLWNLCIAALLTSLIGSRLLLLVINWRDVARHPLWMVGLATIHHPLLVAAGVLLGGLAAIIYARWQHLPLLNTADALAAPIALGIACEQLGALLAGSGYGTDTHVRWAITYTNVLAARWSGAPLGVPVHPVQAYAAIGFLTLSLLLLIVLPARRQSGDVTGVALMGAGVVIFLTEIWRDWEGRGSLLHGALNGPQIAAVLMVIAGAILLRKRAGARILTQDTVEGNHG